LRGAGGMAGDKGRPLMRTWEEVYEAVASSPSVEGRKEFFRRYLNDPWFRALVSMIIAMAGEEE